MSNTFRYIAYNKLTGRYAHYGASKEQAISRTLSLCKKRKKDDFVVVNVGHKGMDLVLDCYNYKLEDAIRLGGHVV